MSRQTAVQTIGVGAASSRNTTIVRLADSVLATSGQLSESGWRERLIIGGRVTRGLRRNHRKMRLRQSTDVHKQIC
jgi:hypothetical protein